MVTSPVRWTRFRPVFVALLRAGLSRVEMSIGRFLTPQTRRGRWERQIRRDDNSGGKVQNVRVDSSDERQRTVSRRSDNVKLAGSVLRGIEEPGLFIAGHWTGASHCCAGWSECRAHNPRGAGSGVGRKGA
jgi:hypothetical protein